MVMSLSENFDEYDDAFFAVNSPKNIKIKIIEC